MGKLTNDDLEKIQGGAEQLFGRVQERSGVADAEAERQVKNWSGCESRADAQVLAVVAANR